MPQKTKIVIIFAIIVALALLVGLFGGKLGIIKNGYSIVYLSTGEVYVGKLSTFPGLLLRDAYLLQVTKDATDSTKNNFQLNPIKDALWAPKSLHLVKDNVIFYGLLSPDSKIAQTLAQQAE